MNDVLRKVVEASTKDPLVRAMLARFSATTVSPSPSELAAFLCEVMVTLVEDRQRLISALVAQMAAAPPPAIVLGGSTQRGEG